MSNVKTTILQITILVAVLNLLSCKTPSSLDQNGSKASKIEAFGEKPDLIRQPYVQRVREHSAVITWKTNGNISNCYLEFQEVGSSDFLGNFGYLTHHEGYMFNEILILNLKPQTTYNYRIYSNGHLLAEGKDYHFTTAPNSKSTAFSFYALGDIGAKEPRSFAKEPANRVLELENKPDFGLGLGDIVYPKGESKNYDQHLFNPFQEVFKSIPFYPVAGNHDWLNDNHDENFKKEWNLPNKEYYYSFSYANTLFIGLDSRDGTFYDFENQTLWLKKTLKENKSKFDWIVIYLHHNGKTCTYKPNYEHVIKLYEVFSNNNVDLILNGHAHTYERLKPYDAFGNIDTNNTNHKQYRNLENRFVSVTIGAGGKINKSWEVNPNNPENCADGSIVAHAEHVPSYALISIERRKLVFEGINSFTGNVFDTFTIEK